jgi:hypothetical protein
MIDIDKKAEILNKLGTKKREAEILIHDIFDNEHLLLDERNELLERNAGNIVLFNSEIELLKQMLPEYTPKIQQNTQIQGGHSHVE